MTDTWTAPSERDGTADRLRTQRLAAARQREKDAETIGHVGRAVALIILCVLFACATEIIFYAFFTELGQRYMDRPFSDFADQLYLTPLVASAVVFLLKSLAVAVAGILALACAGGAFWALLFAAQNILENDTDDEA